MVTNTAKPEVSAKRIALADIVGNASYSLATGAVLDYCSGLDLTGIATSRGSAILMNLVTAGPYGLWREKVFKLTGTNEKSGRLRKILVDSFQVPVYATAVAIGSLVSEGEVNWEKSFHGATYLAAISPFVGPTMGWFMDGCRKVFGVKTAAQGAYDKLKEGESQDDRQ
jgi:hypothetical protein